MFNHSAKQKLPSNPPSKHTRDPRLPPLDPFVAMKRSGRELPPLRALCHKKLPGSPSIDSPTAPVRRRRVDCIGSPVLAREGRRVPPLKINLRASNKALRRKGGLSASSRTPLQSTSPEPSPRVLSERLQGAPHFQSLMPRNDPNDISFGAIEDPPNVFH